MTKEQIKKVSLIASYKALLKSLGSNAKESLKALGFFFLNTFYIVVIICILPIYPILFFSTKTWALLAWELQQKKYRKQPL